MARDSKHAKYSKNVFINNIIWYSVGVLDYLNTSAIYSGYVTSALLLAFRQSLQFIFFPIYAIDTAIYAVLGVVHLLFDRDKKTQKIKKENVVRLTMNIISAVIVAIAVIGTLAFASSLGVATTVLFALNLAITGIYNYVGAGYHLYKFIKKGKLLKDASLPESDQEEIKEERKAHLGSMIGYFVVGTTTAMIALAGGLALLGGYLPLAAIGIAAGVIGAVFCAYAIGDAFYKRYKESKNISNNDDPTDTHQSNSTPDSTFTVLKGLCNGFTERLTDFANSFRFTEKNNEPRVKVHVSLAQHEERESFLPQEPTRTSSPRASFH